MRLEPDVRELATHLIDDFELQGPIDFVEHFARPLPLQITCRLIGIPDADHNQIHQWGDAMVDLLIHSLPAERQRARAYELLALYQYMGDLLEQRRHNPQDDLATALLQASVEQDQTKMSQGELIELLVTLVSAGFETTMNFLSACLLLLIGGGFWETLDHDPQHLAQVVEEALRLVSPLMGIFRMTTQEVHLGGVTLPPDAMIYVVLSSANRDERLFPHPETLYLQRDSNRHMAFGSGIHFCIAAPFAR